MAQDHNIFEGTKSIIQRADIHYANGAYAPALSLYERALKNKDRSPFLYHKIAQCHRLLNQTKEAELAYQQYISNADSLSLNDRLHYAQMLLANGKLEESKKWFTDYSRLKEQDSLALKKIKGIINLSLFLEDSLSHPIKEVNINSSQSEFSPVFYKNGIVFPSARGTTGIIKTTYSKDQSAFLDLYYSKLKKEHTFSKPKAFSARLNTKLHEGPLAFYDKETKVIFTRSVSLKKALSKNETTPLGLFHAELNKRGKWINITALPLTNEQYSVAHPSISTDGNTLYFVSNKKGGYGGTDLYVSFRLHHSWSYPVNLGPEINTSGNESFPYIHNDSILYFSSTGFEGLGGLDIYKATGKGASFSSVYNLGYPINSSQDDFGIVFSPDHKTGYFSSNRKSSGNDDDLYFFEVVENLINVCVKGRLNNKAIKDPIIRIYEHENMVLRKSTNDSGYVSCSLKPGKTYLLEIAKANYKTVRQEITTAPLQDTITLLVNMEKEMRSLVKGVIKKNGVTIPNVDVMVLNRKSLVCDTLSSNEKGEFSIETDPDEDYLFVVEHQDWFGKVALKNSKGRKGTFLFYANIDLHPYHKESVHGFVKRDNRYIQQALVVIENTVTGSKDSIYTDVNGHFSFEAKEYADYLISAYAEDKKTSLPLFNLTRNKEKNLLLTIKE